MSHLLSFLSCLDRNGTQNSDGAQNRDGIYNSDGNQNSDGAQYTDGTPESCWCFPEGLSTTSTRTEVVRPSCSRTAVPIWKLLSTRFYHFLGCSFDLYTRTFNAFMILSHISKYKQDSQCSLSSSPFRTFVGNCYCLVEATRLLYGSFW